MLSLSTVVGLFVKAPFSICEETNFGYCQLIQKFKQRTGYGLVVNTSFNVRGEPIVCTPDDAFRCFMSTEMDYLVMGDFIYDKNQQAQSVQDRFPKGMKDLD